MVNPEHLPGVSRVVESRFTVTSLTVAGLMALELIRTVLDLVDIVAYLVVFDTQQVLPTSCHPIRNSASDLWLSSAVLLLLAITLALNRACDERRQYISISFQ